MVDIVVARVNGRRLTAFQLANFAKTNTPVVIEGLGGPEVDLKRILEIGGSDREVSVAPLQHNKIDKWLEPLSDWHHRTDDIHAVETADLSVLAVSGKRLLLPLKLFLDHIEYLYADGAANGSSTWKFLSNYIAEKLTLEDLDKHLGTLVGKNVWLGPSSTSSRLHYDAVDTLFYQAVGKKRFSLLPPSEFETLVPEENAPLLKAYYECDMKKPASPRFIRETVTKEIVWNYSRTERTDGHVVELAPGDALFLPAYWWHEVKAIDDKSSWCLSYSQVYRSCFGRLKMTPTSRPSNDLVRLGDISK